MMYGMKQIKNQAPNRYKTTKEMKIETTFGKQNEQPLISLGKKLLLRVLITCFSLQKKKKKEQNKLAYNYFFFLKLRMSGECWEKMKIYLL